MKKIWDVILKHKIRTVIVILIIAGGGYYVYSSYTKSVIAEPRYVLSAISKGTLMTTISGSGQISVSNQVELKPTVSGKLTTFALKNGDEIKQGQVVARIDATDANKAVRDAAANVASSKLSLEKLQQPVDELSILQSEHAVTSSQESKAQAEDNIDEAFEDAFNSITNAFLDLPTVVTGLESIISSNGIGLAEDAITNTQYNRDALYYSVADKYQDSLKSLETTAVADYQYARTKYDLNFNSFKLVTRYSSDQTIESLLSEVAETTKALAQSSKSVRNYLDGWADYRTQEDQPIFLKVKEYQNNLSDYVGVTNNHLSTLLALQRTIADNRASILSADRTISEKNIALSELKKGTDPLDLKSAQISLTQRQNSLYDAQEKLADYTIKAPFDGVIAVVNVKKGDTVSSGTSLATLITKQQMAEISLNEVDVAKIKIGDKVTLAFDAIADLSLTGQVAEIDALGTVSQGVVTYNVKIFFDAQDERIKPGMSVSASIMTNVKQDVLLAPNAAVKTFGDVNYVEMLENVTDANATVSTGITSVTAPKQVQIEVGISNDTSTEITSGLKEGDLIIIRTITPSATTTQTTGTSLFQLGGGTRGATGGALRTQGMPRD